MAMRILVGAASIAVVAFVAVWFWDRHYDPDAVAARERAEECQMYRNEMNAAGNESGKAISETLFEMNCKEGDGG